MQSDNRDLREKLEKVKKEAKSAKRTIRQLNDKVDELNTLYGEELHMAEEKRVSDMEKQHRETVVAIGLEYQDEIRGMKKLLSAHGVEMSYLRKSSRQKEKVVRKEIDIAELTLAREKARSMAGLDRNVSKPLKKRRLKKVTEDNE